MNYSNNKKCMEAGFKYQLTSQAYIILELGEPDIRYSHNIGMLLPIF